MRHEERAVTVEAPGARIDVRLVGAGRDVVLLPSLGRGVEDFARLAGDLAAAGHRAILPQPRGIGRSAMLASPRTLHDLALDVARVIAATCDGPATVLGHAFGNRVARTLATDHPELVRDVILLAAGGKTIMDAQVQASLRACFDLALPDGVRLAHVARAFFAEARTADCWRDGWYPEVATVQAGANRATPVEDWWRGGDKETLILQPVRDAVAPAENARDLAALLGTRARIVEIADAGHAALPEQPEAISAAVLAFLAR